MCRHRRDISLAAARRAYEQHLSMSAAGRQFGTSYRPIALRVSSNERLPYWRSPHRYVALLHRAGATLPEIADRFGISQRGVADAIRRAYGLPQIGA